MALTEVQVWVGLIGGVLGILVLVISNVFVLTRFFSQMTSKFDVLNEKVGNLGLRLDGFAREVNQDFVHLGDRVETAVRDVIDNTVEVAKLKTRLEEYEKERANNGGDKRS